MWILAAPILSALFLTGQDPDLVRPVDLPPTRTVASEQQRSASGRCGPDEVGVVWSVWTETPRLRTVVNGRETDLSGSHPDLAAFAGSGGVQRAYLMCRPDDTIEVTFFRGLTAEEGPTEYTYLKFTFDRTGHVARVFPVRTEEPDGLRSWFR